MCSIIKLFMRRQGNKRVQRLEGEQWSWQGEVGEGVKEKVLHGVASRWLKMLSSREWRRCPPSSSRSPLSVWEALGRRPGQVTALPLFLAWAPTRFLGGAWGGARKYFSPWWCLSSSVWRSFQGSLPFSSLAQITRKTKAAPYWMGAQAKLHLELSKGINLGVILHPNHTWSPGAAVQPPRPPLQMPQHITPFPWCVGRVCDLGQSQGKRQCGLVGRAQVVFLKIYFIEL